ncbi:MAG: hypothetical protein A3F68_12265 [Acidobacteria bacterium RIFCSPLOWO2_12_FULL_54_10]|nr:MAG: hypothetical protein A3F68_12265 [Acidobacteria bacterium RIFCSPLOWO2_12_FULL_54_10]
MRMLHAFILCQLTIAPVIAFSQSSAAQGERFCRAQAGYKFEFPRDHFSHPCFKTEWWYFTGNLHTETGQTFGFELTFFREGIDNPYPNPSLWRVDDLYAAHFAISDGSLKKHFYAERIRRAGIGMAGVDANQGKIWNGSQQEEWSAALDGNQWDLKARDGKHQISLILEPRKPPILQGNNGFSQKSSGEGNASHYYSLTRLATRGQIMLDGRTYEVSGWSWMDHEFATNQLSPDQTGWDWVSLQMEDGTELMLYQFRRKGGEDDPFSSGSFVEADGKVTQLTSEEFQMVPIEVWTSPRSHARYPIRWRIAVPRLEIEAEINAAFPEQELVTTASTGVIYWEGSISASGQRKGKRLTGRGYLEMTGYAGPLFPGL